jgi:hypothetical protein
MDYKRSQGYNTPNDVPSPDVGDRWLDDFSSNPSKSVFQFSKERGWITPGEYKFGKGGTHAGSIDVESAKNAGAAIGNKFVQQLGQKSQTEAAGHLNQQANLHEEGAGRIEADSNRHRQLAEQDPAVRAQQRAATKAAAQAEQTKAQMSGASGGGAAALAAMNVVTPEVEREAEVGYQQQREGEDLSTQGESYRQIAEQERAGADEKNRQRQEVDAHNTEAEALALQKPDEVGKPPQPPAETSKQPETPQQQPEIPQEEEPTDVFSEDAYSRTMFPPTREGALEGVNWDEDFYKSMGDIKADPQTTQIIYELMDAGYKDQEAMDLKHKIEDLVNNPQLSNDEVLEQLKPLADLARKNITEGIFQNTGTSENTRAYTGGAGTIIYKKGGYTGPGPADEVAGIVHKGEYVIPKKDVDQKTGLPFNKTLSDKRVKIGRLARAVRYGPGGD